MFAASYPYLLGLHMLAALAGFLIALFAEIGRIRAVADGTIDGHERTYLKQLAWGMRIGALILIVTDILLAAAEWGIAAHMERALTPGYWFELTLIVFLIADLWLMAKRFLPLWFGGAASLCAYGAILLTAWAGTGALTYMELLVFYALGIFAVGGLLEYAHILTRSYALGDQP